MNPVAAGHLRPASPCGRPVTWAATGRSGGVSEAPWSSLNLSATVGDDPEHVQANRRTAAALVGAAHLCVLDARHGATVQVATGAGIAAGADGVVTREHGLALLALAADCVPVVLADPDAGVIAAAHCGWRGLGAGIIDATVRQMRALGATDIIAISGPAICAACYPVGQDCIDELRAGLPPQVLARVARRTGDQWRVDVRAGVHLQLQAHGVQVRGIARCTFEDAGLFSYRRDAVTGRHGMIVVQ
ncbi:MAG: peptidoglycan editing factor PgeF [Candidatus Nanopelagicales bacterium]|nr:peptidoglycan editing factor PgeF [Candidatus Nanopelagicales bacterium]